MKKFGNTVRSVRFIVLVLFIVGFGLTDQIGLAQDYDEVDAWCDDPYAANFEQPIKTAMNGEGFTISLYAVMPIPPPNELDDIASRFQRIAALLISARSASLYAVLPLPPPRSNYTVLAGNAMRLAQKRTEQLEDQILTLLSEEIIDEDTGNSLLDFTDLLYDQIAVLPTPPP